MLKKQISRSRRLGQLKTDSARLLYTWIIPHLDIKGRLEADPSIIKGEIVPRLDTFTTKNIQAYLEDMHRVELITLYKYDGDQFLQLRKFEEHQSLRPDKEAASHIPDPDSFDTTPVQLPSNYGTTPDEDKISKEKISKDKRDTPPTPSNGNFELFWSAYPKKYAKKDALKAWKDINPNLALTNKMIQAINVQALTDDWIRDKGRFIPLPATWIRGERWIDQTEIPLKAGATFSTKQADARSCYMRCHGNCAALWTKYKENTDHQCHWCTKFDAQRGEMNAL